MSSSVLSALSSFAVVLANLRYFSYHFSFPTQFISFLIISFPFRSSIDSLSVAVTGNARLCYDSVGQTSRQIQELSEKLDFLIAKGSDLQQTSVASLGLDAAAAIKNTNGALLLIQLGGMMPRRSALFCYCAAFLLDPVVCILLFCCYCISTYGGTVKRWFHCCCGVTAPAVLGDVELNAAGVVPPVVEPVGTWWSTMSFMPSFPSFGVRSFFSRRSAQTDEFHSATLAEQVTV